MTLNAHLKNPISIAQKIKNKKIKEPWNLIATNTHSKKNSNRTKNKKLPCSSDLLIGKESYRSRERRLN